MSREKASFSFVDNSDPDHSKFFHPDKDLPISWTELVVVNLFSIGQRILDKMRFLIDWSGSRSKVLFETTFNIAVGTKCVTKTNIKNSHGSWYQRRPVKAQTSPCVCAVSSDP